MLKSCNVIYIIDEFKNLRGLLLLGKVIAKLECTSIPSHFIGTSI